MSSIDWLYLSSLAFILLSTLLAVRFVEPLRQSTQPSSVPFDLHSPDRTYSLPPVLGEISAVAISPSEPIAWAVNDEDGTLYTIDLNDGSVQRGQTFAKAGDYEGIELVEGTIVVARSDGTLWRVSGRTVQKIESPISESYDVEGLAFDSQNSRLLVACKGKAGRGSEFKHARAVYAVQVPTFEWIDTPAFVVQQDALRSFIQEHGELGRKPRDAKLFAPSAIAVDPMTGELYILSSRGGMLVVLDRAGDKIVAVATLNRGSHAQPEGLAFDTKGSLYISNEGRGAQATLYRFDRREGSLPLSNGDSKR